MTNKENSENTKKDIPKLARSIRKNLKEIIDAKEKENNLMGYIENNKNLFSKIGVYGANISGEVLSRYNELTPAIGNGYGAIGFAVLDILAGNKNNKFHRLAKSAGFVWYVGECVYDLVSVLNGEYNSLANFPLDVSMAWHLGAEQRKLYKEAPEEKDPKEYSVGKDLEGVLGYFMPKKEIETSTKTNSKKSKSFREYLSNFGRNVLTTFELGAGFGYGVGKSAIEKIKENYKARKEKAKERKKIENEEKAKAYLSSNKEASLKKKKQILFNFGEDTTFMKNYEIENSYTEFKQKPIDEQIKIMQNKKSSLEKSLAQTRNVSFLKRMNCWAYISDLKSELKEVEKILLEFDIEKKNPPRGMTLVSLPQRSIDKFL